MTVAKPSGLPAPSIRNSSASKGPGACSTSLSGISDTMADGCCHPFPTTASSVLLHHSTLDANEVGFECFWPEKSEYKNFSLEGVVVWYVGRL